MDGEDAGWVTVDLNIADEEGPLGSLVVFGCFSNVFGDFVLPLVAALFV